MKIDFRPDDPPASAARRQFEMRDRAVRRRLFFLIFMLVLVILAMREAGKPENYAWLTRLQARSDAAAESNSVRDITETLPLDNPESKNSVQPNPSDNANPPQVFPKGQGSELLELTADPVFPDPPSTEPTPLTELWSNLLGSLDSPQQVTLFRLVTGIPGTADQAATVSTLLERFDTGIQQAVVRQMEASSLAGSRVESNSQVAAELASLQNRWTHQIRPVLDRVARGEPLNRDESQSLDQFRLEVQQHATGMLEDLTEVARPKDSLAWLLAWKSLLSATPPQAVSATPFDLASQPRQFRGRLIRIDGTVRGIESIRASENPLGLDRYWILWIQPAQLDRTPYCVYATSMPGELQGDAESFRNVRIPVQVTGLFWKIRTYVDTQNEVSTCPLILAREILTRTKNVSREPYRWQPANWLLWLLIVLLPGVAIAIAWGVYRAGRVRLDPDSPGKSRSVRTVLTDLAQDDSIASDRERMARFEREQANRELSEGKTT